ncbi:MAG: uroporphyrinogen-III synthase [Flavipsychrobacter sp.]|jgi:uroporphyrinogen-III synthase|nr:uroporphyrinogen-III synthase [Flavipsychrobacter sp.]
MKINTYILSTAELNDTLVHHAMDHGVEVDAVSFIQVKPVKDDNLLDELKHMAQLPMTVVFTSANAINAMADVLAAGKPNWNVYCIGNATKRAVLQYFDESQVKGTAMDGALLANVIKTHGVKEVVFFCGDKRLDALPLFLFRNDIMVHEIVVYKTTETPEQVKKHYQGILFFSPNGVNSFFRINNVDPHTVLFAIGNTTAAVLKAKASNKIVVSETPSKERMVEKVIEYFHK